jgi:hypothetical protein
VWGAHEAAARAERQLLDSSAESFSSSFAIHPFFVLFRYKVLKSHPVAAAHMGRTADT